MCSPFFGGIPYVHKYKSQYWTLIGCLGTTRCLFINDLRSNYADFKIFYAKDGLTRSSITSAMPKLKLLTRPSNLYLKVLIDTRTITTSGVKYHKNADT